MQWSKIKNIVILILVLLNAFLLVSVLKRQHAVRQYDQSAFTKAVQILEQNGISVQEGALTGTSVLHPVTSARDMNAENTLVQSLLGADAQPADQGGGLFAYVTDRGTALMRAGGDCSVQFAGCLLNGKTPSEHARSLMKQMGVTGELLFAPPDGDDGEVVFRQTMNGNPIWSCRVIFAYADGQLLEMNGTLAVSSAFSQLGAGAALDLPNALLRFLSGVLERGDLCSLVEEIRIGYRLTQSFGTDLHLSPVWLVRTNVGSYYLDGVTGELEPAED